MQDFIETTDQTSYPTENTKMSNRDRCTGCRRPLTECPPSIAEPPDGTRLEFEMGTDVYAIWRDDHSSRVAGWPDGNGGKVWCEYGRSVPDTWTDMIITYGACSLALSVRLVPDPRDLHLLDRWPTAVHERTGIWPARHEDALVHRPPWCADPRLDADDCPGPNLNVTVNVCVTHPGQADQDANQRSIFHEKRFTLAQIVDAYTDVVDIGLADSVVALAHQWREVRAAHMGDWATAVARTEHPL